MSPSSFDQYINQYAQLVSHEVSPIVQKFLHDTSDIIPCAIQNGVKYSFYGATGGLITGVAAAAFLHYVKKVEHEIKAILDFSLYYGLNMQVDDDRNNLINKLYLGMLAGTVSSCAVIGTAGGFYYSLAETFNENMLIPNP